MGRAQTARGESYRLTELALHLEKLFLVIRGHLDCSLSGLTGSEKLHRGKVVGRTGKDLCFYQQNPECGASTGQTTQFFPETNYKGEKKDRKGNL